MEESSGKGGFILALFGLGMELLVVALQVVGLIIPWLVGAFLLIGGAACIFAGLWMSWQQIGQYIRFKIVLRHKTYETNSSWPSAFVLAILILAAMWAALSISPSFTLGSDPSAQKSTKSQRTKAPASSHMESTWEHITNRKQEFVSALRYYPFSFDLIKNKHRVIIRTDESNYERAKIFAQWFAEASWTVVEISKLLRAQLRDGITLSAPADSAEAEAVHVAFCKIGIDVNRDVISSVFLNLSNMDHITLEIGNLEK